jgi:hypothetical protein
MTVAHPFQDDFLNSESSSYQTFKDQFIATAHEIFPPYHELVSFLVDAGANGTSFVSIEVSIGGSAPTLKIVSSIMQYYFARNSTVTFESAGITTLIINGHTVSLSMQPLFLSLKFNQIFIDAYADDTSDEYAALRNQVTSGMNDALPSPWSSTWDDGTITSMTFSAGSVECDIEMSVPTDIDVNQLNVDIATGIENSEVMRNLEIMEAFINGIEIPIPTFNNQTYEQTTDAPSHDQTTAAPINEYEQTTMAPPHEETTVAAVGMPFIELSAVLLVQWSPQMEDHSSSEYQTLYSSIPASNVFPVFQANFSYANGVTRLDVNMTNP